MIWAAERSAMAANKVPGVRAANGSSVALARNAREHNYANLLTLGSGQLDEATALDETVAVDQQAGE